MTKPTVTHIAYVLKRETRTRSRWLEIGEAQIQIDGAAGTHHVNLNRLPLGGFGGHIMLFPRGQKPPEPIPETERPAETEDL